MKAVVVTDTSCLIALERVGHLQLLPGLFTVLAPPAVAEEFGRCPDWMTVRNAPPSPERLVALDKGESEAIALALSLPSATLLIDEARGRAAAARLRLQVTGTAGVLLKAKRHALLPLVGPVLEELVLEHSFRLSDRLFLAILERANES
ncbi:MAG: DUF3368 domain-containing protein [Bacteroidota bacterium]